MNEKTLIYTIGDATQPEGDGNRFIVHICNDIGGWGRGFVVALSNRWKAPETAYRDWFKSKEGFELGALQLVQVEASLWVANMIAQHHTRKAEDGTPPIRYEALRTALQGVAKAAMDLKASIHMPRIGAGLAGGNRETIEGIIVEELVNAGLDGTVYDLS